MTALTLWWHLQRRSRATWSSLCTVIAFAAATAVLLVTLGGLGAFTARGIPFYILLADVATIIVTVPVIGLGIAASRLSVSRRTLTLARLRLAGATSGQVTLITLADAVLQALAGALLGIVGSLLLIPLVALIPFQGRPFTWGELWVGPLTTLAVGTGVVAVATVSATLSLAAVRVSPLGVANRVSPASMSVLRAVLAAGLVGAWLLLWGRSDVAITVVMVGLCFGGLGLVGPLVMMLVGRLGARAARTPAQLLAARRIADDPRGTWRSVGTVAMATFVAGGTCTLPAFAVGSSAAGTGLEFANVDIPRGAILTLTFAALLAAVSVGVTQTTQTLDRAETLRQLHLAGTDLSVMKKARSRETWLPLAWAMGVAIVMSLVMSLPLFTSVAGSRDPFSGVITFGVSVVVAWVIVMAGVWGTQGLVRRVVEKAA